MLYLGHGGFPGAVSDDGECVPVPARRRREKNGQRSRVRTQIAPRELDRVSTERREAHGLAPFFQTRGRYHPRLNFTSAGELSDHGILRPLLETQVGQKEENKCGGRPLMAVPPGAGE